MKKELFVLGFVFILLSSLVVAVENVGDSGNNDLDANDDGEGESGLGDDTLGDVTGDDSSLSGIGDELGGLGKDLVDTSELNKKSDEILMKEIEIPENLQLVARIVFGLKSDDKVDLQTFVVLIGLWIILLIFFVSLVGLKYSGAEKWLLSVVATLIITIIGVVKKVAIFLIGFGNFFGFLEEYGWLKFIFILGLIVVLSYILFRVLKIIKNRTDIEEAVQTGYDIALERATAKATREIMVGK